jgi:5,10-methylenetetrahydrofolate reductase
MIRSLADALAGHALLFEPVPPTVRSNPLRSGLQVEELVRLLRAIPRLDAVDVPELVDENHDGRPYYRTGDTRRFARTLLEQVDREVVVNKVVAHLPSSDALEEWVAGTVAQGLRHVVLVGGTSRYIPYPGPPVLEANRVAIQRVAPAGGLLGNIAIPQRVGEARRMLAKTQAGARFFTTQILFDSESIVRVLREYDRLTRDSAVPPASVLLSFAPLADDTDCEFVRWLGADIPEAAETAILNGEEDTAAVRSVRRALDVFEEVRSARSAEGWSVPLGVNVEQISLRHLTSAVEMLRAFSGRMDP